MTLTAPSNSHAPAPFRMPLFVASTQLLDLAYQTASSFSELRSEYMRLHALVRAYMHIRSRICLPAYARLCFIERVPYGVLPMHERLTGGHEPQALHLKSPLACPVCIQSEKKIPDATQNHQPHIAQTYSIKVLFRSL